MNGHYVSFFVCTSFIISYINIYILYIYIYYCILSLYILTYISHTQIEYIYIYIYISIICLTIYFILICFFSERGRQGIATASGSSVMIVEFDGSVDGHARTTRLGSVELALCHLAAALPPDRLDAKFLEVRSIR